MPTQTQGIFTPYALFLSTLTGFFTPSSKKRCLPIRLWFLLPCALFFLAFSPKAHALTPPISSTSAAASLTFSYAKGIDGKDASSMVKALVYVKALREVYGKIRSQRVLAFATQQTLAQMALVAELYTESFTQQGGLQQGNGTVHVRVVLSPKNDATTAQMQKALSLLLPKQSLIAMRLEWLTALSTYAQQGEDLLLYASGIKAQTAQSPPQQTLQESAAKVGRSLEALWLVNQALEHFDEIWHTPHETMELMQQASQWAPHLPLVWTCLGEAQLLMDSPKAALHSLDTALKLEPMRGRALYIRALTYLRLQQPSLAKIDIDAALTVNAENAHWLEARGATHKLLEEYDLMCQDFTKACALGQCQGLQNARNRQWCLPSTDSFQ